MTDLYLISTFREQWNRDFNSKIAFELENMGLKGYFAHRDTDQKADQDVIFSQDTNGIKGAKTCLAIAKNESPNWGAEIGYAHGKNIPIIAIKEKDHEIPLICNGLVSEILEVDALDDVNSYLDDLVAVIKKEAK